MLCFSKPPRPGEFPEPGGHMLKVEVPMQGLLVMNEFGKTESFLGLQQALLQGARGLAMGLTLRSNAQLLFDASTGRPIEPLPQYDYCLFWDKDILLGQQLEGLGLRLFNPIAAIALADDKVRTHLALARAGLPQPRTIPVPITYKGLGYPNLAFLEEALAYLGLPLVIKERRGSFGWQVYLAHTREEAAALLQAHAPAPMLLQEYIGLHPGEDIRIYVVGEEPLAAIRRQNPHDFRANLGSGGRAEAYAPTPAEKELARAAIRALGLDFGGVDILHSSRGPLLCEVNSNAHFQGLSAKTGVDVGRAIFSHIRRILGR